MNTNEQSPKNTIDQMKKETLKDSIRITHAE